jgi:large subunit ribosomal protein L35
MEKHISLPARLFQTPPRLFNPHPLFVMAKSGKTRKSASKRFKKTGTGKLLFHSPGSRHLLSCKSRKRKRRLAKVKVMSAGDAARYSSI